MGGMHQHNSRSVANLESVRTGSRSQATTPRRALTSDLDLQDKDRMKLQNLKNKIAQLPLPEDAIMHIAGVQLEESKYLFDKNTEREFKSRSVDHPVECVEKVVGERLDKLTPRTLNQLTPRTLTQRIEEKEAELDMIRRAVKNQRLHEVELKQSSVSISLDNIEGSDDHHSSVGSLSASRNHSRSTCPQSARGRISCASASVTGNSTSFCGKTSETGSVKVQMNQQHKTSASMTLPIGSVSHWRDTAGLGNLVVEGVPTHTPSRRSEHVPSISSNRPRLTSPCKHNKVSPASPEYRGVRASSRLSEW